MALLPGFLKYATHPGLPPALTITSRATWGAVEPNLEAANERGLYDPVKNLGGWLIYDAPLSQVLHTLVVHHTATFVKQHPRQVQRWHMQRAGLADIAYHFIIDAKGEAFEGRTINVRGAHTGGHNTGTIGVALLGHFDLWHPSEAQIVTLKFLITHLKQSYALTHLAGHRDFQPGITECPGQHLAIYLPTLAESAGLIYGTGGRK
ncbi:MAG: N-acetylmuramoyl-L-alanine amidase [Anaerolineae bacterium]|nr:N-acetylmuramoyl-L-alanine amidase [Anaerolineae bacterium]